MRFNLEVVLIVEKVKNMHVIRAHVECVTKLVILRRGGKDCGAEVAVCFGNINLFLGDVY